MALFGGESREAKNEALEAELARVGSLSIGDLAAEAMNRAFGSEGLSPSGDPVLASDVSGAFIPGDSTRGLDHNDLVELDQIAAEGIQALEHAGLVRCIVASDDAHNTHTYVTATRAGRAALESNSVDEALKTS